MFREFGQVGAAEDGELLQFPQPGNGRRQRADRILTQRQGPQVGQVTDGFGKFQQARAGDAHVLKMPKAGSLLRESWQWKV